ncbi:metal binding domain of Ada-domain-containing protein [Xylaria sp. FL1777]|nr:metal binding domain of Ada-domain-containing protein [Xylaria sp. FL1777]
MARGNTVAIPRDKTKSAHPSSSSTDETRWRLILTHTPTSSFLYGVLSTGIFCRTSCPSRRPRRANVRFFDSAPSAVAAGFRACRRCRPESTDASHESPRASAQKQVEIACEYLRQHKGEAQLLQVAAHVGLSPRYLHGLFKQILGTTPGAYAATIRQESSAPMTPVTSIQASTPPAVDFSTMTDLALLAPIDDGACKMSFADPYQTTYDWFPESLEGPGYIDFDQGQYPEWLDQCDLDIARFLGMDNEAIVPQMDINTSDYVDPSLLNS